MYPGRLIFGALFVAMMGAIAWAFGAGDFWKEFAAVWAIPWGRIGLLDLGLGFLLMISLFFVFERTLLVAIAWTIALLLLGNAAAALWFAINGREIWRRLGRA